jgi:hypothetical protein
MSSVSQEILPILWNRNVHYHIHKHWQPVPTLSPINPAHASPTHVFKIHFNTILPSRPRSSKWSLSFRSPTKILYARLLPHVRATRPAHYILQNFITRIIFAEQFILYIYIICEISQIYIFTSNFKFLYKIHI